MKRPPAMIPTRPLDPAACRELVESERWQAKVLQDPSGCAIWLANKTSNGYGRVRLDGRKVLAHRVAFVAATGADIPAGYVADHLCNTPSCVRPEHLRVATQRANTLRGKGPTAQNVGKTHCPAGHLLEPGNLRRGALARGRRACLACARERNQLRAAAARALGLSQPQYHATYGSSRAVAVEVIDRLAAAPGPLTDPQTGDRLELDGGVQQPLPLAVTG